MSKNILIRCDASKEIGLGHVIRCLTLALQFRKLQYKVIFAMKNNPLGLEEVKKKHFEINIATENKFNYDAWLQSCIKKYSIKIFIGDVRDGLAQESIKKMKKKGVLTVAIDEPSSYRKMCDLCFYPPVDSVNNLDWDGFTGKIYKGFEYVLLRSEFFSLYEKKQYKKFRLLVMMGGTDPYGLTLPVIKNINLNHKEVVINVVLYKSEKNYQFIKENYPKIKIHNDVDDMASLMSKMDYSIVSFGVSAYELLALKIPATHICVNKDQNLSSTYFQKRGFAQTIHKTKIDNSDKLIDFNINIDKTIIKNCDVAATILKEYNSAI